MINNLCCGAVTMFINMAVPEKTLQDKAQSVPQDLSPLDCAL